MRIPIPFTGSTYKYEAKVVSSEECVNLYLRPTPSGDYGDEKMVNILVGIPGLVTVADLAITRGVRCLIEYGDVAYFAVRDKFYSMDLSNNISLLGSLKSSVGLMSIATNGLDITMVDGSFGYVYSLVDGTFQPISDTDFHGGNNIVFIDGYYITNRPGTGQIWRSDFNSGYSWGPLAFTTAGEDPDNVIALEIDGKDLWVLGDKTGGAWYNRGEGEMNFAPIDSTFVQEGIVSPFAHCADNNAVYWLSKSKKGQGQVFQAVGRVLKVISTQSVTRSLSEIDLSDAFLTAHQFGGHHFVLVTVPSANLTWVYDSYTGEWHQRSSRVGGDDKCCRIMGSAMLGGDQIVGDYFSGKLYRMDRETNKEGEEPIIAIRTSSVVRRRDTRITVDELVLLTETGVGKATGSDEDVDPQMMVSWSRDGGVNWSPEVDVPMGKIGEVIHQRVNQLGQGNRWAFRIRISADVQRVIVGAYVTAEEDYD